MNSETANTEGDKSKLGTMGWLSSIVSIAIIAALTYGFITWTYSTEPEAQREGATKQTAMLVDVENVRRGVYTPVIYGLAEVQAARDIILSPRVEGRITGISDNFVPGGFVEQDEVLVEIDPSDYENLVQQRKSELRRAESDLAIEKGHRDVAQKEYSLLDQKLTEDNKALVLRKPQLKAARAAVLSAEAALEQATLELERTTIEAPFDAQILSRNVNLGSQVEPGMDLARLVGIDEYWVVATVPVSKLERIAFPQNGAQGANVIITHRTAWPKGQNRQGRVIKLIGALDNQTRLARILVGVQDPLALSPETEGPKMIVGTIVQAEIQGRPLENVVRIDRDHLREDQTLWVKSDGKLSIRNAEVVFQDKQYAYIAQGLDDGDLLVTSNLSTVAEGVALRTESETQRRPESGE